MVVLTQAQFLIRAHMRTEVCSKARAYAQRAEARTAFFDVAGYFDVVGFACVTRACPVPAGYACDCVQVVHVLLCCFKLCGT